MWQMAILVPFLLALAPLLAAGQDRPRSEPSLDPDQEERSLEPEYTFNPLQAEKEMKIGDFYFRKKSYKAAAGRYEEATRWNPQLDEAFYKLGRALEEMERPEAATQAFEKYLASSPDSRRASEVKKRIAELKSRLAKLKPNDSGARTPAR
jgi:outer membrane protein assembly factor BamD (BamD/ComL family)